MRIELTFDNGTQMTIDDCIDVAETGSDGKASVQAYPHCGMPDRHGNECVRAFGHPGAHISLSDHGREPTHIWFTYPDA